MLDAGFAAGDDAAAGAAVSERLMRSLSFPDSAYSRLMMTRQTEDSWPGRIGVPMTGMFACMAFSHSACRLSFRLACWLMLWFLWSVIQKTTNDDMARICLRSGTKSFADFCHAELYRLLQSYLRRHDQRIRVDGHVNDNRTAGIQCVLQGRVQL